MLKLLNPGRDLPPVLGLTEWVQLGTRLLWRTLPGPPPHQLRAKDQVSKAAAARLGTWSPGSVTRPRPSLGGAARLSGSCAVIGRSLQRASRLVPWRPLRFELHICGFARASPDSEAGFCLGLLGIGRFLCPLQCCLADWCVLCMPRFLHFSFIARVPGTTSEVLGPVSQWKKDVSPTV